MPSKPKKHTKTPSNLSYLSQSASPLTSSSSSSTPLESEFGEQVLSRSLEEASIKFPSLISKSAFIGRITDVESRSKGCRIWLSESAMVASSLVPGSIVSVSLASPRKKLLTGFPLDSLRDECAKNLVVDVCDSRPEELGNYFALAMVFPSCKVLKDEVRLSWNLSSTMGCPALGRIIFVFPIRTQSLTGLLDGSDEFCSSTNPAVPCLLMYKCKELYLELIAAKNELTVNGDVLSSVILQEETDDRFESGKVLSPKTPLRCQSKLNSPVLSLRNSNVTSFDTFDIRKVLVDEKSKQLLQTCAASWLHNRCLLSGNLVSISILSQHCVFLVKGSNKLSVECSNLGLKDEGIPDSFSRKTKFVEHVNDAFVVNNQTKVNLCLSLPSVLEKQCISGLPLVDLDSEAVKAKLGNEVPKLGGLSKEFSLLKDIIISSSVENSLSSLGLRTTKGVLLHGPPGTGKTSLARSCALDTGVNLFPLNGPEIVSQYYGESEKALHDVFDSASRAAPAVVFIDELDAIAPSRKDGGEDLSQRMVATLLNLMDGISRTDGILVIAATNRPDSIDPALRRPGRLDREIEIGVPSPKQRLDILHALLSVIEHSLADMQIQHLASTTHGFVGADIAALCNEAALVCLRRYVKFKKSHAYSAVTSDDLQSNLASLVSGGPAECTKEGSDSSCETDQASSNHLDSASSSVTDLTVSSENFPSVSLTTTAQESPDTSKNAVCINGIDRDCATGGESLLKVAFEDFEKAKIKIRPSAMREVILEVPKVSWEDVGGQDEVKKQLMEAVQWPQKHQDAFERIGTRPPTGILMFGPPGCSKTLMARAVASEAGLNFFAVKGPELFSKWVGESEKAVRSLFSKARANAPSIIFFDELDGLAIIRGQENDGVSVADRVMSQLLVELDGLHQRIDVTVIAATNRPDKIDPALLRPGRFDRLLYVGPPTEMDRKDIFHIHLRKMPCSPDVCIEELACLTEGYTGADISLICREAAVAAMEENFNASEIKMEHLKTGIGQVRSSEITAYEDLTAKFQRLVCTSSSSDDVRYQSCSSTSRWALFRSRMKFLVTSVFWLPAVFTSKASP